MLTCKRVVPKPPSPPSPSYSSDDDDESTTAEDNCIRKLEEMDAKLNKMTKLLQRLVAKVDA